MTITSLERRLVRIDGGGDHGRVEEMSDAQLVIRRGMSPAMQAAYDAATAEQREAILDAFVGSLSRGDVKFQTGVATARKHQLVQLQPPIVT